MSRFACYSSCRQRVPVAVTTKTTIRYLRTKCGVVAASEQKAVSLLRSARIIQEKNRQQQQQLCQSWNWRSLRRRNFSSSSSEIPGGADLLLQAPQDTAATTSGQEDQRPKIVLEAYGPTGFDVSNMIQKVDRDIVDVVGESSSGDVHMTSSILVFDRACFLWKHVSSGDDVTYESLSAVLLYKPKLKYLFIGCNSSIPTMWDIKKRFKEESGIVVEQLTIHNAMGTFNILNGEDRSVAAALVLEKENDEDEIENDDVA